MRWAWAKLDGPLAVLNAPMKALEGYLTEARDTLPRLARIATTDATVTTLFAVTVPVNTTKYVEGYVIARRTGGSSGSANDGAGYRVRFVAKNTAGTAALIGAGSVTTDGESQAGWDVTLSASSDTIRVRVTGAAGNSISWRWSGKSLTVKDE